MKILKYIILLFLITSVSLSIFLFLQPNNYDFIINKKVNVPIEEVTSFLKINSIKIGKQSFIEDVNIKTENTTYITQIVKLNKNNISILEWELLKNKNNTIINVKAKGELNFLLKLKMFLQGGIQVKYKQIIDDYLLKII